MRALYCLNVLSLLFLISCQPSGKAAYKEIDINNPNIVWAKRTNFKVDFNQENDTKNIKVLDKNLATILLEEAEQKRLPVFDPYDGSALSNEQVDNIFHKIDSVLVTDPDTYEEELKIVRNDLDTEAVKRYRVEQEWFFNKEDGLSSRLISITPLIEKYGSSGNYRGDAPLFKIKLD